MTYRQIHPDPWGHFAIPVACTLDPNLTDLAQRLKLCDKRSPHLVFQLVRQLAEVQSRADAEKESLVECFNVVGREEEGAAAVPDAAEAVIIHA